MTIKIPKGAIGYAGFWPFRVRWDGVEWQEDFPCKWLTALAWWIYQPFWRGKIKMREGQLG